MKPTAKQVTVRRDCPAILIPAGLPGIILEGSEVLITQSLGDSFTVNDKGRLLRVAGCDADALGLPRPSNATEKTDDSSHPEGLKDRVMAQLKSCYDPEIPINIVDLGLVYQLESVELVDGRCLILITMTLTAAGCGMGAVLTEDIRQKVQAIPGVDVVEVKLVYEPPWSHEMMSDAAKLQLGLL